LLLYSEIAHRVSILSLFFVDHTFFFCDLLTESSEDCEKNLRVSVDMDKAVATFPLFTPPTEPRKKFLPMIHTTWDPAVLGLGRVENVCPELLQNVLDDNRDVDQIKAFLVDVQGQTIIVDRVELEAERNGPYRDEVISVTQAKAAITQSSREESGNDAGASENLSWKGPYVQQMEDAFRTGLELVPPSDATTSNFPQPSYAEKWHEKRRDDMCRQHPDVAAFCKANGAFPVSVAIGVLGALLNVYTLMVYVPRICIRTLLSTVSYKQSVLDVFSVQSVFGGMVGGLMSPVEAVLTIFSPFSVMGNWMETNLADTYKVIGAFVLVVHITLLAAVWGWWTNTTTYVMTCELMMETVGGWLAVDAKPSRSASVQTIRYLLKHVLSLIMNPMAISGVAFEHALLGYRGHVEHLGTGEVLQAQHRILTGISACTGHLDGGLSLPHHVLMQQRRWKAVLKDKHGVPVQAFPTELLKAARLRHFVSRTELLREEARLLENGGRCLGDLSLLDSAGMESYIREEHQAREAAVSAGHALDIQYGAQKRAMNRVMLFSKEFYSFVRGASVADMRILSSRGNFQATDPRPLKSLVELVHPAINESAYHSFSMETAPSFSCLRPYPLLSLAFRDSGYLLVYFGKHWFDSITTLPVMSWGLLGMHLCARLQNLPVYRHTVGRVWALCGRRYQRDNHGMFLSVEGCLLLTKRVAGLMWQGLRYSLSAFLWFIFIFWKTKAAFEDLPQSHVAELGYSSWILAAAMLMVVSFYEVISELFAFGFLWHPMWFVYATGHLTIQQTAAIQVNATTQPQNSDWAQPTVSLYSTLWSWLTFGLTLHVEQHDFPKLPWYYRFQLRSRAPKFYGDVMFAHFGVTQAVRTYTESKGWGVYAGHSET
jgi:hypothetical protein